MKMTPNHSHTLDDSTRLLKAFADPVRLRLLNLLGGEQAEICVCHLHETLELPQPTVSRHLAILRDHGLVAARKQGLWVHYRMARPRSDLHRMLLACLGNCLGDRDVFQRDRDRLASKLASCGGAS